VTYRRGEDGTHADLVLILSDAFALAPSSLWGSYWRVFEVLWASKAAGVPALLGQRTRNPL